MTVFRTQDLLVSLQPKIGAGQDAQLCIFNTTICVRPSAYCRFPTNVPCIANTSLACCNYFSNNCGRISITATGCTAFGSCTGPGGSACDTTYVCPGSWWQIDTVEDLAAIREDLKQLLTQLDTINEKGLPSQFATRADAEAAEAALASALEQVRAQKKDLK